jgi:hypothetical protein
VRSLALEVLGEILDRGEGSGRDSEAALLAGELEAEDGDDTAALARFQQAAAGRGQAAARGQVRSARQWRRLGQPDRAVIEYLKVPILFPEAVPEGVEARLEAALLQLQEGKKEEAAALLREVVADPAAGDLAARAAALLGEAGLPAEPAAPGGQEETGPGTNGRPDAVQEPPGGAEPSPGTSVPRDIPDSGGVETAPPPVPPAPPPAGEPPPSSAPERL